MKALQSTLLSAVPGVEHGFGTRAEPVAPRMLDTWQDRRPKWRQVHGAVCAGVESPGQEVGDADAVYTAAMGIPVAVQTADCVPLLFARADGAAVAAVHAGWRGTEAEIAGVTLTTLLRAHGGKADDWRVAIGPAIGICCYEVSPELAAQFRQRFDGLGADRFLRGRQLDLPELNRLQLQQRGVKHVEVLRHCTKCSLEGPQGALSFFSHRHKPGEGRQWAVIRRF